MGKVKYYWKKYIWNLPFMVAVLVMGLVYYKLGRYELIGRGMMILEGLVFAQEVTPAMRFVPVMVCFPYIMKFHEERSSGSYKYALLRVGKRRYAVKKVLEASLSGACAMLLALVLYSVLICGDAAAHGLGVYFESGQVKESIYEGWIEEGFGLAAYLALVFFLTLQGAFWACIGTLVGMFVRNRRLAVVGPFCIQWTAGMILPESLENLLPYFISFNLWTITLPLGGFPYVLAYVSVAIVVSIIIVYFGVKRLMGR